MLFILEFVFFLFLSGFAAANPTCVTHDETFVPDAILRVTAANETISCYPSKKTVLVNGTAPGPELRLQEGRTSWIRVYNDMDEYNVTMHWHGLSMAVSPFADGTPQVSQWPIPPHHFFDYEIRPEEGMAGTYFYHSHVGFQAVSAAGPLIVDEIIPPYLYEEDKIIFVTDHFIKDNDVIEAGLVHNPLVWSGEPAMVLINGKGGGNNNVTFCNASLAIIDVEPGKTYRLRFIGATALTFAHLEIEGHDLSVIEADGSYTKPVDTPFMQLGPGQRFSTLLHTKTDPKPGGEYFIQVETRERNAYTTRGYAVLRYSNPESTEKLYPPPEPPFVMANTSITFLEYQLAPLADNHFPTAAEVTRRITITVHQSVQGMTVWKQNHVPWTETYPTEPYLVSLYKNDGVEFPSMERALANYGVDPITRVFPALIGEVLEIIIQNTGADANGLDVHPFHAHGAHYWDIGCGNGTYNASENEVTLAGMGHQPVKRDTTMLYRYEKTIQNGTLAGWRGWRLRVNQPGAWMIHCHILQHMLMGMQTVWVFGNKTELLGRVPEPEVEGYLTYGGDVYGNEEHWPTMVHFKDYETWSEDQ